MTEEERLKRAPGCGGFIMLGLIVIVLLSMVGLIFPMDVLPYPNEVLAGILVAAFIALVVTFFMLRGRAKDRKKEEDDKADALLRKGFETLGDEDDEAARLAEQYYNSKTNSDDESE